MRPERAIVIGAGPAGSLAGVLLARAGVDVTLIEQGRFPRHKVCGECLSALGLNVLRRHDLARKFESTGVRLTRAALFGRSTSAILDLPAPMMGISRLAMDAMLFDAARDAGVRVLQPARADAVEGRADGAIVRARLLPSNEKVELTADVVIVADGRGLFGRSRPAPSGDLGIKVHFTGVTALANAITLYGGFGCYGGVAPIEDGRWNVAFAVPQTELARERGDIEAWWNRLVKQHRMMQLHFAAATRVGEWMAAPLPRFATPGRPINRVVPVGAAAGAIEPVGGEGMGTALKSAELAVDALLHDRLTDLPAAYRKLWRSRSFFCRLGGRMMSGGATSDLVSLAAHPTLGRIALAAVGK